MPRGARPAFVSSLVVLLAVAVVASGPGSSSSRPMPSVAGAGGAPYALGSTRMTVASAYVPPPGVADLGPVGANRTLTVDVGLASRDPSGLEAFVNSTAVPGTPAFRQFLSPASAAARFGAAPGALAAAESYFETFGLSVSVHPDGLLLSISGSVPAVARAFGTTIDLYRNASGGTFLSHPSDASLPAVAPWTGAFGLDGSVSAKPDALPALPEGRPTPATACSSSSGPLTPCEVATAYDFPWVAGSGTNGSGRRIAVIDAYSSAEKEPQLVSDFDRFTSTEGLAAGNLSFLYPVPTTVDLNLSGTNPGWSYEDALDIEWARAAAPGASIEMVFSPDAGAGLYYAIDWVVAEGAADVLSMSWGEPEVGIVNASTTPCSSACNASSDGSIAILDPVLELGAAEGISTFAASGDCGASDGTSGVAVNYPASDPYVTGVGATDLTTGAGGKYVSESGWSGNSTGAKAPGCTNQGGSGGGFSVFPQPWWQTGPGTVASAGRGVPDVAIVGGDASPVTAEVGGGSVPLAGTSVGTPIWAGIAATADQAYGSDLGWLNPGLYAILASSSYTTDFHEIATGNNGYAAHDGWNPVTGIGTPIVAWLLPDLLRGSAVPGALATEVYASPRFGPAPLTVRFAVAVHGGSGTYALEGVEFGDGNSSAVSAGVVTHTFANAGVYAVQSYAVDSTGNESTSPAVVVVVGGGGPLSVELNASSSAPAIGTNVSFTANVTGGTGPFLYNFSFGDGAFSNNLTSGSVGHVYHASGSFCAEVVVRNTGGHPDGGASPRLPVAVGGAVAPSCGNPAEPLELVVNTTEGVRDAPADFPSLFTSVGGSTAPDGLEPQVALLSLAPTNPYTAACACTILTSPGTYTLQEWENDTVNGEANATASVTVAPPISATFHASVLAGPVPLSVTFTANATGGYGAEASATHWRFGDGSGANGSSVVATYATPGEYVAIASLSDRGDGNASEAFLIDAEAAGTAAVGITGTVTPAVNVSSGETLHWSASPVGLPPGGSGDLIAWDLGNGGSAFGPFANETYSASVDLLAGNELVASVSLDSPSLAPLVDVPITLPGFFATEAGGFVPAVDDLVVAEEVYPASGVVPLVVSADVSASGPGGAAITLTFGDGGSGGGVGTVAVQHVYYGAGDFTVQVDAYDGFSDLAVRLDTVVANAALSLSGCGARTRQGTAPYAVDLAPTPSGGAGPPYTYRWTLPNGTTSTATNLSLSFSAPGTFVITLVVSDAAGALYGCAWSITVTSVPPVSFLEVVAVGAAAGVGLTALFLWATRPRPPSTRPPADPPWPPS